MLLRLTAPVGGTSYTWANLRLLEARLNGVKLRLLERIEYSPSHCAADAGDDEMRLATAWSRTAYLRQNQRKMASRW